MSIAGFDHLVVLAAAAMLVSPWKPLILLVTLGLWAWLISTVYDKHAARFFLPRKTWNLVHCGLALVGLLGALAIPAMIPIHGEGAFWAGWAFMLVMLASSLAAYAISANKDERVPDEFHIKLDILTKLAKSRDDKKKSKQAGTAKLAIRRPDKSLLDVPAAETPEFETRVAAEKVFLDAIAARASQIDIAVANKESYAISYLVDGVRSQVSTMPVSAAVKVIDLWKGAAGLDINDRRRKLSADTTVEQNAGKTLARVSSVGDRGGMRLTLLFEPTKAVIRKPTDLGLLPDQMIELKALVDDGTGVVLLAGVPDGGRTTTFYSILQLHDAYTKSIQTLEVDPQATLEGIRHQAFDPVAEGAEFGTTVRSLLRRDPDVLAIGELIDPATAKEAAKSDAERTRVYLALRAESALSAVDQYIKAVEDNTLAAKGLRGVVVHKLLRKLCTNCRVNYPPTPDMLKKMGVNDASKVPALMKKGGQVLIKNKPEICPACNGVGYVGQEGIFEVVRFDDDDRAAIAGGNLLALKANMRKRNTRGLQQSALAKAIAGITSVEEVMRVTAPPAPPAAASPQAASPPAGGAPPPKQKAPA